jgi:diacylglycerol O-acyltransferase/trehalose O-mycolyltransferase
MSRRRFTAAAAAAAASVAVFRANPADALTHPSMSPPATAVADNGAMVVAATYVGPRTLDLTIDSLALASNTAMVRLLLPPGWSTTTQQTWPVLYLLHGAGDDYTSWTRSTDIAQLTADLDVIVVMPTGGTAGFYSNWWNLGGGGAPAWEIFHLVELRQILERGYAAAPVRVIGGLSMGGFGAMSYAARNPGMFRAAASYSGVLDTVYFSPDLPLSGPSLIEGTLVKDGYDPADLWGSPTANAAIWATHNPDTDLLAPNLVGIPLFVSSGNGQPGPLDPPGTPADPFIEPLVEKMSESLVDRLRALGANVTADFYGPGIHNWPEWQQELHRSFPLLMGALGV